MATQALHSHDFPPGTVVSAYLREQIVNGGPPTGVAVTSATVDAAGALAFTGLTEGLRYVAYAGGRGVSFFMAPGSTDTLRPMTSAEAALLRTGTVKNSTDADPINTASIFHGIGGYNPDGSGIPNIPGVIDTKFSTGGIYADSSAGQLFHSASYVNNTGSKPTVATFSMGKGHHTWARNAAGYSNGPTDVAIGDELDYGNVGIGATTINGAQALPASTITVASTSGAAATGVIVSGSNIGKYTGLTGTTFTGVTWIVGTGTLANGASLSFSVGGTATGLVVVAEGGNIGGSSPGPYAQFQSNTASEAANGVVFNNSGQPAVALTGILFKAAAEKADQGIGLSGSQFGTAAGYFPLNSGSATASVGLLVSAEGGFANAGSFADFRSGAAGSSAQDGLVYRVTGGRQPVVNALIKTVGGITSSYGGDFSGATFGVAAFHLGDNGIKFGTTTGGLIGMGPSEKFALWGGTRGVQPVVSGSKASGAALASLLTALASRGFINDTTTA